VGRWTFTLLAGPDSLDLDFPDEDNQVQRCKVYTEIKVQFAVHLISRLGNYISSIKIGEDVWPAYV
jgi:hypothetical protein